MAAGNSTDTCASDGSGGGGMGEVLAGVAIAVVASVGINIGNNVQVPACLEPPADAHRVSGWAGVARGRGEGEGEGPFEAPDLGRSATRPARGLTSGQSPRELRRAPQVSEAPEPPCAPRVRRRWG